MLLIYLTVLTALVVSGWSQIPFCPSPCTCYIGPYSDFMVTSMTEVMKEAHFTKRWNASESYVNRKLKDLTKPEVDNTEKQIQRWRKILDDKMDNVTHITCNITKEFDLGITKRFLAMISRLHVSMTLICTTQNRGPVRWASGSFAFFGIIASLRFENCDITPDEMRIIPASPNLLGLEFVNINSDFLDNLQFNNNSNLVSLQISYSHMESIPEGLRNRAYPNLLWLALNNNQLRYFDCDFISGTPLLMELYLQNNQLPKIPECLCRFKNLWLIPAYGNYLRSFDSFSCFSDLLSIDARHNEITALKGKQFRNLQLLQDINLSYNQIAYIEKGTFSEIRSLRKIILANNQIGIFDSSMIAKHDMYILPMITIDLRYNNLSYLPFYDPDTPQLGPNLDRNVTIYIKGNTFYCGCELELLKLFMHNSAIKSDIENATCFVPEEFEQVKLVNVDISVSCRVNQWCPRYCKCIKHIKVNETSVSCAGQKLEAVPSMIPKGNVSILDLHNNNLVTFLNHTFLPRVHSLDVSYNKLNVVTIEVFKYGNSLNLSHNRLSDLPHDLNTENFNVPKNMKIDLRYNPLNCSGANKWISKWIDRNRESIVDHEAFAASCSRPKDQPKGRSSSYTPIALDVALAILFGIIFIIITLLVCYRKKLKSVCGYYCMRKKTRSSYRAGFLPIKVLLVCSDRDSEWVFEHLILPLEGHHPPYSTFLKSRDKKPGTSTEASYDTWMEESDAIVLVISPNLFKEAADLLNRIREYSVENPQKPVIGFHLHKAAASEINSALLYFIYKMPHVYKSEPLALKTLIYHINQVEVYSSQNSSDTQCQSCRRSVNNFCFNISVWFRGLHICGLCDCRKTTYQDTTELTPQEEETITEEDRLAVQII